MSKAGHAPLCPICGVLATKQTTRWGDRYAHCGLWAWGRNPLADAETHEARKAAHAAFDPLWKSGRMSRRSAYKALSEALGIQAQDCHMKLMPAEVARRVPAIAAALWHGPPAS